MTGKFETCKMENYSTEFLSPYFQGILNCLNLIQRHPMRL